MDGVDGSSYFKMRFLVISILAIALISPVYAYTIPALGGGDKSLFGRVYGDKSSPRSNDRKAGHSPPAAPPSSLFAALKYSDIKK